MQRLPEAAHSLSRVSCEQKIELPIILKLSVGIVVFETLYCRMSLSVKCYVYLQKYMWFLNILNSYCMI